MNLGVVVNVVRWGLWVIRVLGSMNWVWEDELMERKLLYGIDMVVEYLDKIWLR